jgi:hypothetical protein
MPKTKLLDSECPVLIAALDHGNEPQMVMRLLEFGADINVKRFSGEEPLQMAWDNPTIVKKLIERGASVHSRGAERALLMAGFGGFGPDTVRVLLEAGANIEARDKHGATLLYMAADAGFVDQLRYLLARGANPYKPGSSTPPFGWENRGFVDRRHLLPLQIAEITLKKYRQEGARLKALPSARVKRVYENGMFTDLDNNRGMQEVYAECCRILRAAMKKPRRRTADAIAAVRG